MNPLFPLLQGVRLAEQVTVTVVRLAFSAPRIAATLLGHQSEETADPAHVPSREGVGSRPHSATAPSGAGGLGRRQPGPHATPGRARPSSDGAVELTGAPPEPTSAAGASGGVGGTAAAPGAAAAAGAPDPTAASAERIAPAAPRRERRQRDVQPTRSRPRRESEPTKGEVSRRRQRARQAEADADDQAVLSFGSTGEPGAQVRVDAPWDGYDKMRAPEVVSRLRTSDPAVRAVVRLYEQTHRKRKSILQATEA